MKQLFLFAAIVLLASTAIAQDMPRVFIGANETLDASNSKDKSKQVDFGSALSAALLKKNVPILVVTDQNKAQWSIKSVSAQKEDGLWLGPYRSITSTTGRGNICTGHAAS